MRQKIIEMKNCPFCGGEAITRTVCGKKIEVIKNESD